MNRLGIGFTLVELLIVVCLLGLIAMIVFPQFSGTRSDAVEPIIQSELSEIQRAFFRLKNDCNLQQKQYTIIAQFGVSVLIHNQIDDNNILFEPWDSARQLGWRGSYLSSESERTINIDGIGQPNGNTTVPVITTPNQNSNSLNDPNYYRILATNKDNTVISPNATDIYQLWLIYPYKDVSTITKIPDSDDPNRKYYRKLIAEAE
ncbi:MAG: prepilin-type N-terminal cleavage/methylation domain-containing protein, partial [Planctomycetaceae bacterium]|nr:prepilin-type N-terminal cleavage/methylation domain-containing protein [Planctomycetaceae bacterium]